MHDYKIIFFSQECAWSWAGFFLGGGGIQRRLCIPEWWTVILISFIFTISARANCCLGPYIGWCDTRRIQWGVHTHEGTACHKQTLICRGEYTLTAMIEQPFGSIRVFTANC